MLITFQIIIAKKDFNDRLILILGSTTNNNLDLGEISLIQGINVLEEVIIYANKTPIYYNKDTLMFVADSFRTKEGSVVEDLLKKIPGIQLKANGKINVNGKEVQKVLVDGDEFFGSDAKIATQNLEAKAIDKIAVYEEESGGEKKQVLDLRLKENYKKGYFGNVNVSSDFNKFHKLNANYYRYNEKLRIGGFVSGAKGLSGGGGGALLQTPEDEDANYWENNTTFTSIGIGTPKSASTEFSFSNQLTKKYKLDFNYGWNGSALNANKNEQKQYILPDTSYFQGTQQKEVSSSLNQYAIMKNEFKMNDKSAIELNFGVALSSLKNLMNSNLEFSSRSSELERRNKIQQNGRDKKQNGQVGLRFQKIFKNKSEFLFENTFQNLGIESKLKSKSSNFYQKTSLGDSLLREISFGSIESKNANSLYYFSQLNKFFSLSIQNIFTYEKSKMKQFNSSFLINKLVLDTNLSTSIKNTRFSNSLRSNLLFTKKKLAIELKLGVRNLERKSQDQFFSKLGILNKTGINPYLSCFYQLGSNGRIGLEFSRSSDFPTFDQTQRGVNVQDPNNSIQSNANLESTVSNSLNASYNSYGLLTGSFIYANLQAGNIENAITSIVNYDDLGRSTTIFANINGNKQINANLGCGRPFFKKWLNTNLNTSFSSAIFNTVSNGVANKIINSNSNARLDLSHVKDSITFGISADFSINTSVSNLNSISRKPQFTQNYSVYFTLTLPLFFQLNSNIDFSFRNGLASGYNNALTIWNIDLRNKFKENSAFEVFASVTDLLNQNVQISREFSPTVITDSKINIVSRVFQFGFLWTFRNKTVVITE